ncbi:MAG: hypothetical protein QNJ75_10515 [Acidimicrobiia bacterium]|nr:hypothetical protein [Acidimicrobiia bacterium]
MDSGRVALGIHDLIPVFLAAGGLAAVAAAVRRTLPGSYSAAVLGAVLVVLGGLSKASAKLIGAVTADTPPQLLDGALFPLLAPGMLLLAVAVVAVVREGGWARLSAAYPALIPVAVWALTGALALLIGSTAATATLIGLATIGNVTLAIALIVWSRRLGLHRPALLFGLNLVIVIGLAGMARALEQTTATEWIEQNVNVVGQLAFLLAARSLLRSVGGPRPDHVTRF